MAYTVVTDPHSLNPPLIVQPLQCLPHHFPSRTSRAGTMDQEQIDIALALSAAPLPKPIINRLHTLQAFLVRSVGAASCSQNLSCEEDLWARQPGLPGCFTHLFLIGIILRRVNVAIAYLEGVWTGGYADGGWRLVDAEAKAWDFNGGIW